MGQLLAFMQSDRWSDLNFDGSEPIAARTKVDMGNVGLDDYLPCAHNPLEFKTVGQEKRQKTNNKGVFIG